MTTQVASPEDVKQLVLVVRSPHLKTVTSQQEADALLGYLDNTTFIRSALISLAAGLYSPVNVYADGTTQEYCDRFANSLLATTKEGFVMMDGLGRFMGNWQRFGRPAEEAVKSLQEPTWGYPDPEVIRKNLLTGGSYRFFIDDINPDARAQYGSTIPNHGISLGDYEIDRLAMMLGLPAGIMGARIVFRPGEYDTELLVRTWETEQGQQLSELRRVVRQRDNNHYQHLAEDLADGKTNAIVYFGPEHEMTPFRRTDQFDVAFVYVRRRAKGAVEVKGTLPYPRPDGKPELKAATHEAVTKYLQGREGTPIKVMVNLEYRERQLMKD